MFHRPGSFYFFLAGGAAAGVGAFLFFLALLDDFGLGARRGGSFGGRLNFFGLQRNDVRDNRIAGAYQL